MLKSTPTFIFVKTA